MKSRKQIIGLSLLAFLFIVVSIPSRATVINYRLNLYNTTNHDIYGGGSFKIDSSNFFTYGLENFSLNIFDKSSPSLDVKLYCTYLISDACPLGAASLAVTGDLTSPITGVDLESPYLGIIYSKTTIGSEVFTDQYWAYSAVSGSSTQLYGNEVSIVPLPEPSGLKMFIYGLLLIALLRVISKRYVD